MHFFSGWLVKYISDVQRFWYSAVTGVVLTSIVCVHTWSTFRGNWCPEMTSPVCFLNPMTCQISHWERWRKGLSATPSNLPLHSFTLLLSGALSLFPMLLLCTRKVLSEKGSRMAGNLLGEISTDPTKINGLCTNELIYIPGWCPTSMKHLVWCLYSILKLWIS